MPKKDRSTVLALLQQAQPGLYVKYTFLEDFEGNPDFPAGGRVLGVHVAYDIMSSCVGREEGMPPGCQFVGERIQKLAAIEVGGGSVNVENGWLTTRV
jgi:hypothetical protein